tara:strand:- start:282 stop:1790 length:1509 start_codon:yes stop_codon:yes gene_type:complete
MVAINDRVKETTTTTGQGTVDLGGAKTGFETFVERIGNGNQTYYCIAAEGGAEFEVGIGTVTDATPDTLSRDTVLSNSDNNTNKVNFSAGTKEVFCTLPASKAILEDSANNMNVAGSIIVGGTVDGVDIQARDGVLTATTTTANAALPKAGGTMTGNISHASNFTLDMGGEITLDADGAVINLHDGGVSTGKIDLTNSDITLAASVADKDIKFQGIDGSSTITALTLDMSSEGALVINSNMKVPDNGKVLFGAGNDLQLSHNSSDAADRIESSNTLQLRTDTFRLENAAGTENMIAGNADGAVTLYHNDSAKLATESGGVTVTGTLSATTISGALSGNISQFTNNSGYVTSSGVTSVATGNGLSGGTITSTGTLTMSGSFSGGFSASGNLTAFSSDSRLKNFKGKIENALDKVDQLNGYYYEWNDVAKNLDGGKSFKDGIEVGVSAQEIEKVLPEVVTEAPIVKIENLDVDYKTVYYDKIVPLLIEAIKELRAEVKKLKEDK